MEKKTLIVNYPGLSMGGIEKYLASLMKYAIVQGYRVIWITTKKGVKESFFSEISSSPKVEKVFVRRGGFTLIFPIELSNDEHITMLSLEPLYFFRAEMLRHKYCNCASFNHFLILPHFTGNWYYPERFFENSILYSASSHFFQDMAVKLNTNDCIRAFSYQHLVKYEQNYNIIIPCKEELILKEIQSSPSLCSSMVERHAEERNEIFNIVTCARLDFPHKGYIIGLVDEVHQLRQKYKQIHLYIIGDGLGRNIIESKIQEHCEQDFIHVLGYLPPEKAMQVFFDGHLNIGLAGGLSMGASCGLPSLTVRHYTNKCETYGYFSDNIDKALCTEQGLPIADFIKNSIDCPADEYCKQSESDYYSIINRKKVDPEYLFKQKNKSYLSPITVREMLQAVFWNVLCQYERFVHKKNGYLDNK